MGRLIRRVGSFIAALLLAYVVAASLATQSVVSSLIGMGIDVPLSERLSMTLHDVTNMTGLFLPLISVGLVIGFGVAALITRFRPDWRTLLFVLAGAAALITLHASLKLALGMTPVAAARSTTGVLLQGLAGAAGGYLYAMLTAKLSANNS